MREVRWVGSSYADLCELPAKAKRAFGYAISEAQLGRKPAAAKPLKGYGEDGVFEVVEAAGGNAYRTFYAIKIGAFLYVLHCFQKKSPRGSETPKPDIETLKARLKVAKADAAATRQQ